MEPLDLHVKKSIYFCFKCVSDAMLTIMQKATKKLRGEMQMDGRGGGW